jgi:ribosomal protein S18 acetylase RimI-like enzyme
MLGRVRLSRLVIRHATLDDLDHCLALDSTYESDEVWQMHVDPGAGVEGVAVRFRATRLPRTLEATYPRDGDELRGNWQQQDCLFVAVAQTEIEVEEEEEPIIRERVLGYIDLHEQRWQRAAWVQNFVVDKPFRGRGIGRQLLTAAANWAREEQLRRLIMEAPTKNGRAIHFYYARGAEFVGFNDRYYTNGDIAVFFEYRL